MKKLLLILALSFFASQTTFSKLRSDHSLVKDGIKITAGLISENKIDEAEEMILFLLFLEKKNRHVQSLRDVIKNGDLLEAKLDTALAKQWALDLIEKAKYYKNKYPASYFLPFSHYAAAKIADPENKEARKKINDARFVRKIDMSMKRLAKGAVKERATNRPKKKKKKEEY